MAPGYLASDIAQGLHGLQLACSPNFRGRRDRLHELGFNGTGMF